MSQRSGSRVHSHDGEAEMQLGGVPDMQVAQSDHSGRFVARAKEAQLPSIDW